MNTISVVSARDVDGLTAAERTIIDDLPGGPQQVHAGWVWYVAGREPIKASTRAELLRHVLIAVDHVGADAALDAATTGET